MQGLMIGTIGLLLLLPESITKWDMDALSDLSLSQKWKKNVKDGPIMDKDDGVINYIGHPVSGAFYYTMARNDGFNPFESFLYSTFVSTFIWEYGYEAFAEIPSIQDLISTPILGSILGEGMYHLEIKLDKNSGIIWGSKYLGNVSYFFLDPIGNISDGLSSWLDISMTMRFETYQVSNAVKQTDYSHLINKPVQFSHFNYGVIINFEF